jgi:Ca2+-binding EF-hand superfamily protein
MPHPHQPLIYSRKQVSSHKKIEWGDPSRLERLHRALRQKYVSAVPKTAFNRNFLLLDKDYPNTVSVRGFQSLLVNSGVVSSTEDFEHLFAFYDAEGHGSLDMNDFLIGVRYNLAMDKIEADRIRGKLQCSLIRGRSLQDVERLLANGGLSPDGITEASFVKAIKGLIGTACTTSELLFLFSLLSGNDRGAAVPLSGVARVLYGGDVLEGCARVVDVQELLRCLARIIYDPNASVSGRIGLNRILARGDKDFNGALNRREFDCIRSFTPFDNVDVDALFASFDTNKTGLIYFDDIVRTFRPQDHMQITEREMAAIDEIAIRHIRNRSPGGSGFRRTYQRYLEQAFEKHDPHRTGFFTLTQFYRALDDLAGGDLKDLEIEILFERWAKAGRVDWHDFLWVLLGEADKKAARESLAEAERRDVRAPEELREGMAHVLADRYRQTAGSAGFLRIERLFDRQDARRSGNLTEDEFRRALRALSGGFPFTDPEIGAVFRSFGPAPNGTIPFAAFIAAMQQILAKDAAARKNARAEPPYPYADLADLREAVVKGATRRRLGKQGLLLALGKQDTDGDGLLDLRAFGTVMRAVCDPIPSEENIAHLFRSYDPEGTGKIAYVKFVDSLTIDQTIAPTEAELREAFGRLAAAFRVWGQSSTGTPSGMRTVFDKYARTTPGQLTVAEFLKAMRSLGYNGPALDAEIAFRHFAPSGTGLTFDNFAWILTGTAMHQRPTTQEGLLERLHREVYGDDRLGTISLARLLNKQDATKSGAVNYSAFAYTLRSAGSTMNDAELKALFNSCGPRNGLIVIRDFLERARRAVIEPTDEEHLRRILNLLGESVEHRNQGLRGWATLFEPYDRKRDGRVDFYGYTRAVEDVHCNKLSDYEKERLFNHFSSDGVTIEYRPLADAVLYVPLNRAHEHPRDAFSRDVLRHTLEPELLDESIPRPPREVLADHGILQRFIDGLYAPEKDGFGTIKLKTYFRMSTHNGRYLGKRDFITAITGLARPASPVAEHEVVALYEQLKDGDGRVDMDALLENARYGQTIRMSDGQYAEMMARIHDHMWDCGKRSLITIREIFHSDVRDDGFVDLNEFTTCMRRSGGGLYTDLELELLFNRFSPDRRAAPIEALAAAMVPPTRLAPPQCAGPTPVDIQNGIARLAAHVYDPRHPTSGTLGFLKGIRLADKNRDDLLDRKDFAEALQYSGASLVLNAAEINALFDALAQGTGVRAVVAVPDLVRLVRDSPAHAKLTLQEHQDLLQHIRRFFPYAPGDPAAVRFFERQDTAKTRRLGLGPFTTAVLQLLNKDCPLTDLQIEHLFDRIDRSGSRTANYMEFLEAMDSLPARPRAAESEARVLDVYRRADVQPDMVRSPVALRPPPAPEVPPAQSPFHATRAVLPLGQPGMGHWHEATQSPGLPYAGGAGGSLQEREARLFRSRGLWVPGGSVLRDIKDRPTQACVPLDDRGSPRASYIAGMDAPPESPFVLPPYLVEARTLEEWMSLLALERYTPLLRTNEVDLQTLSELSEADLQDMGLPIGPRRKILKAARHMH